MPTQQETYDEGDMARLWGEFRDADQNPQDPAVVNVTIREPGGKLKTYTYGTHPQVVKDSAGNYYIDYSVLRGWTFYRFHATGTGQAAGEQKLYGRPAKAIL